MKLILMSLFVLALPVEYVFAESKPAPGHPTTDRKECRKKADEVLAAELKECKLKPKDDQRSCTMAALDKNSDAITRCGTAQVIVPPT